MTPCITKALTVEDPVNFLHIRWHLPCSSNQYKGLLTLIEDRNFEGLGAYRGNEDV